MLTKLFPNPEKILSKRYYIDDKEDWPGLCHRVVDNIVPVSCLDYKYDGGLVDKLTASCFYMINNLFFLPNSPTMFNAGTEYPMLSACFIIDVEDDLPSIYDSLKESAMIHKMGGGVGLNFGKLRGNGSKISTTHGKSGGVVSFVKVFSSGTAEITAAGKRRGANMGQLPVWHCDIEEFIDCKRIEGELSNFNLTVQLTDSFMKAVEEDTGFNLYDPKDMSIVRTIKARDLMDKIVKGAKKNGEPGICFIDRINRDNPTPHLGKITSSNPCQPGWAKVFTFYGVKTFDDIDVGDTIWSGENWTKIIRKEFTGIKPVFRYKTPAGSFVGTENHLVVQDGSKIEVKDAKYIDSAFLPYQDLGRYIRASNLIGTPQKIESVEFVAEEKVYNITVDAPEHTYWTGGLLVSNCGEYFSIPYSSCNLGSLNLTKYTTDGEFNWDLFEEHIRLAIHYLDCIIDSNLYPLEKIDKVSKSTRPLGLGVMGFADVLILMGIKYNSKKGFELAEKLSEFLSYVSLEESVELSKIRGPYPEFKPENHTYKKYVGTGSMDWCGLVEKISKYGLRNSHTIVIAPTGTIATIANEVSHGIEPLFAKEYDRHIMDEVQKGYHHLYKRFLEGDLEVPEDVFILAKDINWVDHIEMQARWQMFTHNSISKTINMPNNTTEKDVYSAFMLAHERGLKGLTVYVEGSREQEVIVSKASSGVFKHRSAPKRPEELPCEIFHSQVQGKQWVVFVGLMNGKPYEIFAGLSKYVELPKKYTIGSIVKRSYKTKNSEYDLVVDTGSGDELRVKNIVETFENANHGVLGRLVSLSLRHGTKPTFLSEQLLKDTDFDFTTYAKCLGRILSKKYTTNGEETENGSNCPECGGKVVYQEGCKTCSMLCGWGKCN